MYCRYFDPGYVDTYVRTYIQIHVHLHLHLRIRLHMTKPLYVHICAYIHMLYVYIYTHQNIYMYVCIYAYCIYVPTYTLLCVYMYIYTCMRLHVNTHLTSGRCSLRLSGWLGQAVAARGWLLNAEILLPHLVYRSMYCATRISLLYEKCKVMQDFNHLQSWLLA